MTLGLALAQSRRIAPALLAQLEQSAREKKSQLIDEIIASGTMSAHDVAIFAADKYQLPLLDLAQYNLSRVPPALAGNREFHAHRLLPHLASDLRARTGMQDFVGGAPLNLVYVAHGERMTDVSAEERRLYASVDAAFIGQNVYLYCASAGLGSVFRGALDTAALGQALHLPAGQFVTFAQTVGFPAD